MKPRRSLHARLAAGVLFGALGLAARPASAQPADESTRTAARALGTAGVEAYQANDFATATDKLEKAYGLLRVPSLGLWSGRALVKVGKLLQAADRFLEATSLQAPAGEYAVQKQAQTDAAAELQALKPRIPSLLVELKGAPLAECTVSIDAEPVASSLLAEGRLVNPGKHVVEARHGNEQARTELTLAEGERKTAVLTFDVPVSVVPVVARVPVVPPPPAAPAPASSSASPQKTWGWVALGVGGVGLVLGGVTGAVALGKKGDIDDSTSCHDNRCAPSESDKVDAYNSMRTVSTIGFIAGGGFAALGVVLLVTAPNDAPAQAWLGPGSAGVRGRF